jgi:hypothetical protein
MANPNPFVHSSLPSRINATDIAGTFDRFIRIGISVSNSLIAVYADRRPDDKDPAAGRCSYDKENKYASNCGRDRQIFFFICRVLYIIRKCG